MSPLQQILVVLVLIGLSGHVVDEAAGQLRISEILAANSDGPLGRQWRTPGLD